jgi:putative DNA primase/helicase
MSNLRLDKDDVKKEANGKWEGILTELGVGISDPIVLKDNKPGPCALCGTGRDRAYRHPKSFHSGGAICCRHCGGGDGFKFLMEANGWSFDEALHEVARHLGMTNGHPGLEFHRPASRTKSKEAPVPEPEQKDWPDRTRRLNNVWNYGKKDPGKVQDCFKHRAIDSPVPDTIRFIEEFPTYFTLDKEDGDMGESRHPAMIAQYFLKDQFSGLHITYLDRQLPIKAKIQRREFTTMCVPTILGSTIQLYEIGDDESLILTEGIETAMSVHGISGIAAWACGSSAYMPKVLVPSYLKKIYICADLDRNKAGINAAVALGNRLIADHGMDVSISLPPLELTEQEDKLDWNDFIKREKGK